MSNNPPLIGEGYLESQGKDEQKPEKTFTGEQETGGPELQDHAVHEDFIERVFTRNMKNRLERADLVVQNKLLQMENEHLLSKLKRNALVFQVQRPNSKKSRETYSYKDLLHEYERAVEGSKKLGKALEKKKEESYKDFQQLLEKSSERADPPTIEEWNFGVYRAAE